MNLVIDYGNTRIKIASFTGRDMHERMTFESVEQLKEYLQQKEFVHTLVSSVREDANEVLNLVNASGKKFQLTHSLPIPVRNLYSTPETLGVDRIAAVCGAVDLFPNQHCLAVDAGTCITFEFLDASGNYRGGSISPGISMRFQAMNQFTARLPLVNAVVNPPLTGASTMACMQSGVMNGVVEEIKGIIGRYEMQYHRLQVILCGGDAAFFENMLKPSIFVAPDLVLRGLNRILLHNVT